MAMHNLSIVLLLTIFLIFPFSNSSLSPSPSPSPQSSPSPSPTATSPSPASFSPLASPSPSTPGPSPFSTPSSPSAPPPSYFAPKSPSSTSTPPPYPTDDGEYYPVPVPTVSDDVEDLPTDDDATSGRSDGGRKAGIALGVIAGACVLGAGAMVYRKRQHNIRRSRYSYSATARREFL